VDMSTFYPTSRFEVEDFVKHIPFNQGKGQKMYADPPLVPVDPFPLRQLT
jgi:hypothetical protein